MKEISLRNRWLAVILSLFMALTAFAFAPSAASANSRDKDYAGSVLKTNTNIVKQDICATGDYTFKGLSIGKIYNIKIKNKKIASVTEEGDEGVILKINGKKVGKTKVSFKIKSFDKVYKYKFMLYICKHRNPFKSFKVGDVEYCKAFSQKHHHTQYVTTAEGDKVVNVKAIKGWKIKYIKANDKKIDNGGIISVSGTTSNLEVKMYNKKAHMSQMYYMNFNNVAGEAI